MTEMESCNEHFQLYDRTRKDYKSTGYTLSANEDENSEITITIKGNLTFFINVFIHTPEV